MRSFLVWKSLSTERFLWAGFFTGSDLWIYFLTLYLELESDDSFIFFTILLRSLLLRFLEAILLKKIRLCLDPLEFLFPGIFLFLEYFSDEVAVINAATKFLPHIIQIITGAAGVGVLLVVLYPRTLEEVAESCFSLQGLLDLFTCLFSNSSIGGKRVVISARIRLEIFSSSFFCFYPAILVILNDIQVFVEPIIEYWMIIVILEVDLVLHSLVQYVFDRLLNDLFGHNFVTFVLVCHKGWLAKHDGRRDVLFVFKQVPHHLGELDHWVFVRLLYVRL